jgi:hypothetical protein
MYDLGQEGSQDSEHFQHIVVYWQAYSGQPSVYKASRMTIESLIIHETATSVEVLERNAEATGCEGNTTEKPQGGAYRRKRHVYLAYLYANVPTQAPPVLVDPANSRALPLQVDVAQCIGPVGKIGVVQQI